MLPMGNLTNVNEIRIGRTSRAVAGSSTAPAIDDAAASPPWNSRLSGTSSFLPVRVWGMPGAATISSARAAARRLLPDLRADPLAAGVVELTSVGEDDEQRHPVAAVTSLGTYDEGLHDLRQPSQAGRSALPIRMPLRLRVESERPCIAHDATAVGDRDPVAVPQHPGKRLEVARPVTGRRPGRSRTGPASTGAGGVITSSPTPSRHRRPDSSNASRATPRYGADNSPGHTAVDAGPADERPPRRRYRR